MNGVISDSGNCYDKEKAEVTYLMVELGHRTEISLVTEGTFEPISQ